MSLRLRKIILPFIYLYVLNPFGIGPLPQLQIAFLYFLMFFYLVFNYKTVIKLICSIGEYRRYVPFIFFTYLIITFFSLFSPIIHNTGDYTYFVQIVLGIIRNTFKPFFLLVFSYNFLKKEKNLLNIFFKNYIYSFVLYVFTTIFFIFMPNIKMIWLNLINAASLFEAYSSNMDLSRFITRWGLAGFSGFRHTIMCSMGIIFNIFLLIQKKETSIKDSFSIIILLMGNVFYGRSGLMISLICIFIYFIYEIFIRKKYKLVLAINCFLLFIFFIFLYLRSNPEFDSWYKWSMAPIESLMKGRIGNYETDYMFNEMYFMPEPSTLLLGDGYWTAPSGVGYYIKTDVGYMRPMLFFGIIPQLFCYFLPIFTLTYIYIQRREFKLLSFLLTLLIFIFELKGEVHYILTGYVVCCLIAITFDNRKNSLSQRNI